MALFGFGKPKLPEDPQELYKLGKDYYNGNERNKDFSMALKCFEKASEKGLGDATNYLAFMYRDGEGTKADSAKAVQLFEKAFQQGRVSAAFSLGLLYSKGKHVPKDVEKSRL